MNPVMGLFDGALFNSVEAFLLLMIILGGLIGVFSGYGAIGAFGAFIIFTYVASSVDLWIFNSMLYIIFAIVFVLMAMQVWSLATSGAESA